MSENSYNVSQSIDAASLALSIIGLVFSILLPIVTYPCSIIGLVLAIKRRDKKKTTAALVLSIIGLVIAVINSAVGASLALQMI